MKTIVLILASFSVYMQTAYALPAFSRQTNMSCVSCHGTSYPALNQQGRAFSSSGFKTGDLAQTEYFRHSFMPSLVADVRYLRGQNDKYASFDWPYRTSMFLAGELSEDVSYMMELGAFGAGSRIDSEQIMQINGLLSSRFQFHAGNWRDTRFSVIPFSTLDQGPGYALELMNTGARRSNTAIAGIIGYSAAQQLGIASSRATGMALTAVGESYFVTYANWQPGWWVDEHTQSINQCAHYLRVARFTRLDDWDLGYGAQMFFHIISNYIPPDSVIYQTRGTVLDFQMESKSKRLPLALYATLGLIPANSYFNPAAKDEIALGIGIKNAISQKWSVYVSMMNYDSGNGIGIAETETVGLEYRYGEQLKLDFYLDTVSNTVIQLNLAL